MAACVLLVLAGLGLMLDNILALANRHFDQHTFLRSLEAALAAEDRHPDALANRLGSRTALPDDGTPSFGVIPSQMIDKGSNLWPVGERLLGTLRLRGPCIRPYDLGAAYGNPVDASYSAKPDLLWPRMADGRPAPDVLVFAWSDGRWIETDFDRPGGCVARVEFKSR